MRVIDMLTFPDGLGAGEGWMIGISALTVRQGTDLWVRLLLWQFAHYSENAGIGDSESVP